jgi:hypothetical protein
VRGCVQASERRASERCVCEVWYVYVDGPSVLIAGGLALGSSRPRLTTCLAMHGVGASHRLQEELLPAAGPGVGT